MTATLAGTGGPATGRRGRRGVVALGVVVVLAVVAVVAIGRPDRGGDDPLSTTSTHADGSRALARLLEARGTDVREVDRLSDAEGGGADRTVLLLAPDAYDDGRLRSLLAATSGPVVLLQPGDAALAALGADLVTVTGTAGVSGTTAPDCDVPAATAAGPVTFEGATPYAGPTSSDVCYRGALGRDDRVTALGDPGLLTNARLADTGVAALDLDLLGSTSQLVWVRPGADATSGPTGSVWSALPDHAETAALWLLGVGVLLVLWRGRRLGWPVAEPLPVVVRSDEIVRGRARLHERTGDTTRSAALLRHATTVRLRRVLALPADAPTATVAREAGRLLGRPVPTGLLDGRAPVDGDELLRLARDLAALEDEVRTAGRGGRAGWTP